MRQETRAYLTPSPNTINWHRIRAIVKGKELLKPKEGKRGGGGLKKGELVKLKV